MLGLIRPAVRVESYQGSGIVGDRRELRQDEGAAPVGLPCLQCGFTPLAGDSRTMKTDKKGALRLQTHLLLDRPEIDWPCRI